MAKNTSVYDTYTNTIYTSISWAVRSTGAKQRDIKASCERYHGNNKIMPRWIYHADMTEEIMMNAISQ